MNRTLRTGAAAAAAALALGTLSAAPAAAAPTGKVKVCVYGLTGGDSFSVNIDNQFLAEYPDTGKCESVKLAKGPHKLTATGSGSLANRFDRVVVKDKNGQSTRENAQPESFGFNVYKKKITKIRIYFA